MADRVLAASLTPPSAALLCALRGLLHALHPAPHPSAPHLAAVLTALLMRDPGGGSHSQQPHTQQVSSVRPGAQRDADHARRVALTARLMLLSEAETADAGTSHAL
jgi:hypothetical protein